MVIRSYEQIGQIGLIAYRAYDFNYWLPKDALTSLTPLTTASPHIDAELMTLTTEPAKQAVTTITTFNYYKVKVSRETLISENLMNKALTRDD